MSHSTAQQTAMRDASLVSAAAMLAGGPIEDMASIKAGNNNAVYRLTTGNGNRFALKHYPATASDPRDRLGTEYTAVELMHGGGVDEVPAPRGKDENDRIALYEWVDGTPVETPDTADIDAAADFMARLWSISNKGAGDHIAAASEACPSGAEVVRQIEARLARLRADCASEADLLGLLADALAPALKAAEARARTAYQSMGINFDKPLARDLQTMSPSDFGFHNAIKRKDGRLTFVDFEYFGWDDPAKLVSDFRLHPGMALSPDLADRFLIAAAETFSGDHPAFTARIHAVEPLYALRWACIVLNVFLDEPWSRRLAAGETRNRETVKRQQFEKAEAFIARAVAA